MCVYCLEIFYNDIHREDFVDYFDDRQKAFEKAMYEEAAMESGETQPGEVYITSGELDEDGDYIMDKIEYLNREAKQCLKNI